MIRLCYPRTSAIEANQVVNLVGGQYTTRNYRARTRVVFQNKNVMCQYRGVGHPIACSVTEGLVDLAAMKIDMDPVEIRRRNLIADDAYPCASPSGLKFELLSHHASMDRLIGMMNYDALRAEQAALRKKNIHRGIGIASFIEVTNPSAAFYGVGGVRNLVTPSRDAASRCGSTCPEAPVICQTSITEQGQGSESLTAQIVGSVLGVSMGKVRVILGDTGQYRPIGAAAPGPPAAPGSAARPLLQVSRSPAPRNPFWMSPPRSPAVDTWAKPRYRPTMRSSVEADGAVRIELRELCRDRLFPARPLSPPGIQPELMATPPFRAPRISVRLHQRRAGGLG